MLPTIHEDVREHILGLHVGSVDVLDPVQTILSGYYAIPGQWLSTIKDNEKVDELIESFLKVAAI